jgi:hypothetical protein
MFNKLKAQAQSATKQAKSAVDGHQFKEQADIQAEKLRNAMKGTECIVDDVIEVLTTHVNWQILQISEVYTAKFERNLVEDIERETTGNLQKLFIALCRPSSYYDVHLLRDSVKGLGTNESQLIEVLCTREPKAIKTLVERYPIVYEGTTLVDDVKNDTSGDFEKLLLKIIEGREGEGREANESKTNYVRAQEDANALFKAGEGKKLGTDESIFIDIFATRSFRHIKAVAACYSMISNKDLAIVVEKEFSKNIKKALLAILEYARTPGHFWAERLKKAMKGLGTDDDALIRVIVSRREIDLPQIADDFSRINKATLFKWIKDDLSGDYEAAVISILRFCKITAPNHSM